MQHKNQTLLAMQAPTTKLHYDYTVKPHRVLNPGWLSDITCATG